ncbi:hypothetical protein [Methyloversatilis sp.]|uniref:hypothetical protein n=1 Tax=Methyloversatilis sp. TaxID=2569862 RepID=UPI002734F475|nr:hypothetical protein [Methyloversatilis sp.]MDP2867274.1 hypothetical protein [Methyloversatilis sp.]MDP3289273.1 hypothetical protein [Methyloversatilis sp.]MDP3456727.1 hypothetical protein [Methyloversatilis sp.]MDP3576963.1 hypothetical protein [Methyloversatilis sp.]
MAKLSRCPHCGQDTIARLVKLMARAKAPAICPACGGRSCTGITPLSLLSFFVLILVCGTLLRAAGRLGNRWTLLGVLALFIGGFLYISFHTGLVKLERYPMQRNIAIAVVALLAIGFSWWWFSRGTAS